MQICAVLRVLQLFIILFEVLYESVAPHLAELDSQLSFRKLGRLDTKFLEPFFAPPLLFQFPNDWNANNKKLR